MAQPHLFLLEDDANLNETITDYLEEHGYRVDAVYDGYEAQDRLYEKRYDLLLLDVNIPGIDGFELLKEARREGIKAPAIFITSLSSVDDLETGFKSGGDDYIRKPFALKELLIRIETLIKRSFFHEEHETIPITETLRYDVKNGALMDGDRAIQLGVKEGKLLKLLLKFPDEVIAHERIFKHLWDYEETPSDTSLRTYIKNLRKIIGKDRIVSIKKQGYKYVSALGA
jgi:DNA-binding response OmpR family regulator